jgi:hypothetical protein
MAWRIPASLFICCQVEIWEPDGNQGTGTSYLGLSGSNSSISAKMRFRNSFVRSWVDFLTIFGLWFKRRFELFLRIVEKQFNSTGTTELFPYLHEPINCITFQALS